MVDLPVSEVVAFYGVVLRPREYGGQLFLERVYEDCPGRAEPFTDVAGHTVVGIGNDRFASRSQTDGVQGAFLHAYAAAYTFGIIDMQYHF